MGSSSAELGEHVLEGGLGLGGVPGLGVAAGGDAGRALCCSTGRTRSLGHIRGPLQFGMARSISPVYPVDHAITRVTQTTQADIDAGERTEMGGKWTIPYALYQAEMHYSATRGTQTRVTPDDLRLLYTTLLNMFDHDRSATPGDHGHPRAIRVQPCRCLPGAHAGRPDHR
jgi:CRISPR/Cas system type I-B associated protein Csh2 (Cas7 group RAMP superfamily)